MLILCVFMSGFRLDHVTIYNNWHLCLFSCRFWGVAMVSAETPSENTICAPHSFDEWTSIGHTFLLMVQGKSFRDCWVLKNCLSSEKQHQCLLNCWDLFLGLNIQKSECFYTSFNIFYIRHCFSLLLWFLWWKQLVKADPI